MDANDILTTIAVSISIISLCASVYSIYFAKNRYRLFQRAFEVEYSNSLIPNLRIKDQNGQTLRASFRLSNHGTKSIAIERIKLSGHAKSSVGDDYEILNDTIGLDGKKVLEAGKSLDFDVGFAVGHGALKSTSLIAFVSGADSKHEIFKIALPVRIQYS